MACMEMFEPACVSSHSDCSLRTSSLARDSLLLKLITTFIPRSTASMRAIAAPRPLLAAVTSATLDIDMVFHFPIPVSVSSYQEYFLLTILTGAYCSATATAGCGLGYLQVDKDPRSNRGPTAPLIPRRLCFRVS